MPTLKHMLVLPLILLFLAILPACDSSDSSVLATPASSDRTKTSENTVISDSVESKDKNAKDEDSRSDDDDDSDDDSSDSDPGTQPPVVTGKYTILGSNDLGMHCAELDYSVFSSLPPFNVVHAQVIETGEEPKLLDDDSGIRVEYVAVAVAAGSINTTSQNGAIFKTNFWDINPRTGNRYVDDLFGLNPPPDEGLLGQRMPGFAQPFVANDPMPFDNYSARNKWFAADGIPLVPVDDNSQINAYPLM